MANSFLVYTFHAIAIRCLSAKRTERSESGVIDLILDGLRDDPRSKDRGSVGWLLH